MNNGELIIYQTEDGLSKIQLKAIDGTVWLTQGEIADLFQTTPQNITLHIKSIYEDVELTQQATCKEYLQVRTEGQREVERQLKYYNLDIILAIGYRIKSSRGTQFRIWANTILKEYLVKGFAMDDSRLKQAETWDYFDEWLARIRDIRSSEKRFYQKIRDLYATAVDYDKSSEHAKLFFRKVQNKMLWAITGETAAELISNRSNPNIPNMGLTSWTGSIVRKKDVGTAKNYLKKEEIERLNRIVTMYLDYAEEQALRRKTITMEQWSEKLDAFLEFNEHNLLMHAGKLQMSVAQILVTERYEEFDSKRRKENAIAADIQDINEIEQLGMQWDKNNR